MDAGEYDRLTPRERDVLALLAEGKSNQDIARALGLSPDTVKNHLTTLYAHLGLDPWSCNPRVVAAVMYVTEMAAEG